MLLTALLLSVLLLPLLRVNSREVAWHESGRDSHCLKRCWGVPGGKQALRVPATAVAHGLYSSS